MADRSLRRVIMRTAFKVGVRLLISAAVSAAMLVLVFSLVGRAGRTQARLPDVLLAASLPLLGAYTLLGFGQTLFRAIRYRVLLRAAGEPAVPALGPLFLASMARNMFVDLLPARVGELAYVGLLNRGLGVGIHPCLSSMSISVLFDFAALLCLVVLLVLWQAVAAAADPRMLAVAAGLLLLVAAGAAAVFAAFPALMRAARRRPWASGRAGTKVFEFLGRLAEAFVTTRRAGVVGRSLLLSLGVRVCKYAGFFCAFLAVAAPSIPSLRGAAPVQVVASLLGGEAAASLPLPTFMSFGSYEAGGAAVWAALGVPAAEAALAMLAVHVWSQAIDYTVGGLGLGLFALLGWRGPSGGLDPRARRVLLALVVLALAGAAGAGAFLWQRAKIKRGATHAPPVGLAVTPDASAAGTPARLRGLRGFVVWSSNRGGNHDIWLMDLPGGALRPVTSHPHAESCPRISPDGARIAFARSRRPWVSFRNCTDWDVVVRTLATAEERTLLEHATAPAWSGPDTVVVQHEATSVVAIGVADGVRRVLVRAGEAGVPAGAMMTTPDYDAASGLLAVTLRGARRGLALIRPGAGVVRTLGNGCQISWAPGGGWLTYVGGGGRMQNAFRRVAPDGTDDRLWFDAPGDWSHEYYPRLSADGRWMVYGASARGHEHDTADYEIFLWNTTEPPAQALRLTWHTSNDNWPDIHLDPF